MVGFRFGRSDRPADSYVNHKPPGTQIRLIQSDHIAAVRIIEDIDNLIPEMK